MNPVLKSVLFVVAALYLAVDELFASVATPIANWLSRLPMLRRVREWISALPPLAALALFLVPVLILEPIKPVAAYMAAAGYFLEAVALFILGEILKLVLVERLFQLTRDQLMTIPAFAWCYVRLRAVLDWLESLPVWQMLRARVKAIKTVLRERIARMLDHHRAQAAKSGAQPIDEPARRPPAKRAQP